MQTCYRHPSEETRISCSSCGNPICVDCMHPSHVGQRCPDCAKQTTKVQTPRAIANAVPQATYALIGINVVAFIVQMFGAGQGFEARGGTIYERGVLIEPLVADGDLWRLASSGFLHEDPVHLLLNMVLLFFLGAMLEPLLGTVRFVAVYVASLFAGGLGVILEPQFSQTIGASGAVYGMLGAAIVVMRQRGINPFQTWVGAILIINVLWTFGRPGISIGGHLGGLVGGALAALVVLYAIEHRQRLLALAGPLGVAVASFVLAIALAQPF